MSSYLSFEEKRSYYRALMNITKEVGDSIKKYRGPLQDLFMRKGHEFSILDEYAANQLSASIDKYLPEFEGTIRREMNIREIRVKKSGDRKPYVIIADELDGTTNTKRHLASIQPDGPICSAISIALASNETLDTIEIGIVYSLIDWSIFSAISIERTIDQFVYHSFLNNKLLDPIDFLKRRGDQAKRILIIGYSNKERVKKGEIEQKFVDEGFRVYDGCRSTSNDIINIIGFNQFDAYIDPRALWNDKGAVLEAYDFAGMLPVALGCGFVATDVWGDKLSKYKMDDEVPLVISRSLLHAEIIGILNKCDGIKK